MSDDPRESEADRLRRDVAGARRSLIIIFGVGLAFAIAAIVFVLRNRPEGDLGSSYPAPPPSALRGYMAEPCKKFGDPCEFSPGKLGACIDREGCTGPHCLFCQSQH